MGEHFVDHIEAFGNGYAEPRDVVGTLLPEDEIKAPHECVPGICASTDATGEDDD